MNEVRLLDKQKEPLRSETKSKGTKVSNSGASGQKTDKPDKSCIQSRKYGPSELDSMRGLQNAAEGGGGPRSGIALLIGLILHIPCQLCFVIYSLGEEEKSGLMLIDLGTTSRNFSDQARPLQLPSRSRVLSASPRSCDMLCFPSLFPSKGEKIEKWHMGMSVPRPYPGPWRVGSGSINFILGGSGSGSGFKFHYKGMGLGIYQTGERTPSPEITGSFAEFLRHGFLKRPSIFYLPHNHRNEGLRARGMKSIVCTVAGPASVFIHRIKAQKFKAKKLDSLSKIRDRLAHLNKKDDIIDPTKVITIKVIGGYSNKREHLAIMNMLAVTIVATPHCCSRCRLPKNSKQSPKKSLKTKPSTTSSSSKLDVRIIRSNSNFALGDWKYSTENYNILFSFEQAVALMKKHIHAVESIINYDYNDDDDDDICKLGAVMYSSANSTANLENIQKTFRVSSDFIMVETQIDDRAHVPRAVNEAGKVSILYPRTRTHTRIYSAIWVWTGWKKINVFKEGTLKVWTHLQPTCTPERKLHSLSRTTESRDGDVERYDKGRNQNEDKTTKEKNYGRSNKLVVRPTDGWFCTDTFPKCEYLLMRQYLECPKWMRHIRNCLKNMKCEGSFRERKSREIISAKTSEGVGTKHYGE
ncbi:hypothetical protein M9H77_21737 [Catharanthus roseus]|uniref:Uncharacterized protein n=1 Tax=Catharanthus roseus TaxID=4058 RepID=A0ACC0AQH8_CATRO|nr:hypothetical protein M9H77_21737 [Catharanthus roseus]